MAEAILNQKGKPSFTAYSAGSHPSGRVHPSAIKQLETARLLTVGLRSKSWDEFAKSGAHQMNFVFTVCDNAARETCPLWPGQPMTAHWGIPDPAATTGSREQIERAFRDAFVALDRRISLCRSPASTRWPSSKKSTASDCNELRSAGHLLYLRHRIAAICVSGVP